MRWPISVVTILILVANSFAATSPSLTQVTDTLEAGQESVRIVCLGDSVTGVYYHSGCRRAWPDMLTIALHKAYPKAKIEMFNAGISGQTSTQGLARLDHDVLARKPHMVAVMFGLNDVALGNREAYRNNLKTIVARCRKAGAVVVLCTLNAVSPNQPRPLATVAEFSQIVRDVAQELSVLVADQFLAFDTIRERDPIQWAVLMSDEIHPTISGHKLFAETVAQAVAGKPISLADVPPLNDSLRFTLARLKAKQPIHIVAMPPYDTMLHDVLAKLYPGSQINVTTWPVEGQSLAAMVEWSKGIRGLKPHLVVPAVPANTEAQEDASFITDYHWIVSNSASYARAEWDLLPILPSVTGPLASSELHRAELARQIIAGSDVECIDRPSSDTQPARQIVLEWIERHGKAQP